MGTPEFAVAPLKKLLSEKEFEVVGVVCQPDRPKGRGNKVVPPPVKEVALEHNIQVFQPEKLSRAKDVVEGMRALNADVIVMVAFGQILKEPVLSLVPHGVINIHGSLLPKYRGAAPINWVILNGETETGITTMKTDAGVDTGDMLLKGTTPIGPDMTAPELADVLAQIGADLIVDTLRGLRDGSITPEKQNDAEHTYAPMLTKEMADIDWSRTAKEIHNQVRGLLPWPGTSTGFRGTVLKISKTSVPTDADKSATAPGTIMISGKDVLISCGKAGDERIKLVTVKPQGKGDIDARDWANGARLANAEKFERTLVETH